MGRRDGTRPDHRSRRRRADGRVRPPRGRRRSRLVVTPPASRVSLATVGLGAHDALTAAHGVLVVFAPLSQSIYCHARDEIVWLGPPASTLHPRAMLADTGFDAARWREGDALLVDARRALVWRPPRLRSSTASRATLLASARALVAMRDRLPRPDGFGALLGGGTAVFPLHDARERARALAEAVVADDPDAALRAATSLLGLGAGLTPSGDDFVGGAFFARTFAADVAGVASHRSRETIAGVLAAAAHLTNPVSAALLADMLHGRGHAPLHDLANALASGLLEDAVEAATRLVRLGHSSGWDIITGFVGGLLGGVAFER